jgi:hypothetical protein
MSTLKDALKNADLAPTTQTMDEVIQETLPAEAVPAEAVPSDAPIGDVIEHEAPGTEVALAGTAAVVTPARVKKNPLAGLAAKKLEEIQALNPDFELDFMNVFTRLKTNTKGQFMFSLGGEDFVLSDSINVKLLAGDYMHQYWGEKDTEQEGTLVCYSDDGQVTSIDGTACADCPYNREMCKLRFAIGVNLLVDGEDPSEIYNINLPQTGAFAFADYVKLVTKRYHTGIKEVVTNMYTVEKEGKGKGDKFNAVQFRVAK